MKDNTLYVFLHIPKCAGTTLKYHILKNFKKHEIIHLYKERFFNVKTKKYDYFDNELDMKLYLNSLSEKQKQKIKVIYGHRAYYGIHKLFNRPVRYITLIREPFSVIKSLYNQKRRVAKFSIIGLIERKNLKEYLIFRNKSKNAISKDKRVLSFPAWLNKPRKRNFMTRFLKSEGFIEKDMDLKKALDKFYFVGLVKNQEDMLFIYHLLKIKRFYSNKNVSKKYAKLKNPIHSKNLFYAQNPKDVELYNLANEFNKKFKSERQGFNLIIKSIKRKIKKSRPINDFISTLVYIPNILFEAVIHLTSK